MSEILIAFLTGLTTGGLSCLAVQGGLLASSLGRQLEEEIASKPLSSASRKKKARSPRVEIVLTGQPQMAAPILLFLGAKLIAYTFLGFLLGLLGSALTLSPALRALMLLAVGIFMIGNALRMLDVHPIFRYFSLEPPSFLRRYVRRTARKETSWFSPLLLGTLTVLIPCGVTQAMMAAAVGTGSAVQGAAILFAFTLGSSPLFFLVAYLVTQIGARLEKLFMRFVAVTVLILGLLSVDNGLALAGMPSVASLVQSAQQGARSGEVLAPSAGNTLVLNASNDGYSPQLLHAPAGQDLTLNVMTENTYSCARAFVIPALQVEHLLPETGTVSIDIPAQSPGTVMRFTCSMGMYTGQIVFDQ